MVRGNFDTQIHDGFSLNHVKRLKNREILRHSLERLLGAPVDVAVKAAAGEAPSGIEKKQQAENLKKEALQHPLVADAVEIFDGTIVDVALVQEVGK